MAIAPDLLYYLNTNAATCLANVGTDSGATAATFVNHTLGVVADAISYTDTTATMNHTNSLNTNYAPANSFAVAAAMKVRNDVNYQHFFGVRKGAAGTTYLLGRTDGPTKTLNESASASGVSGLLEPGWCVVGVIFTAPTSAKYYLPRNRVIAQPLTMNQDITTNDATGTLRFGGAGLASGYTAMEYAEAAVWKTAPTQADFKTALGQMQARCIARGLAFF